MLSIHLPQPGVTMILNLIVRATVPLAVALATPEHVVGLCVGGLDLARPIGATLGSYSTIFELNIFRSERGRCRVRYDMMGVRVCMSVCWCMNMSVGVGLSMRMRLSLSGAGGIALCDRRGGSGSGGCGDISVLYIARRGRSDSSCRLRVCLRCARAGICVRICICICICGGDEGCRGSGHNEGICGSSRSGSGRDTVILGS